MFNKIAGGARRRPFVTLLAVLTVLGLVWVGANTHVYDAPGNAGVVVGPECVNVGWEWKGDPGPIVDTCD